MNGFICWRTTEYGITLLKTTQVKYTIHRTLDFLGHNLVPVLPFIRTQLVSGNPERLLVAATLFQYIVVFISLVSGIYIYISLHAESCVNIPASYIRVF